MWRRRILRYLLPTMMFLFACAFQTTVWPVIMGGLTAPPLWLLVITWLSIYRPGNDTIVFLYFLGFIAISYTSMPLKMMLCLIVIIHFILISIRGRVFWPGSSYFLLTSAGSILIYQMLTLLVARVLEPSPAPWMVIDRVVQVLLAIPSSLVIYSCMTFMDRMAGENLAVETGGLRMSEYISNPDEAKEYWGRYKYFYALIALTFVSFFFRLWYLQVVTGSELREFSEKNRIKQNKIAAPRGLMLDREGKVLVENLPGFEAILSPQYIEDEDELAKEIGPILNMTPDKLLAKIEKFRRQNGEFAQIRIKENLSRDEVFRLKRIRLDTPGLEIRESILRHYPLIEDGAQLFGYVGEISKRQIPLLNDLYKGTLKLEQGDIIGKSGLEESLEKDIRGTDGISFIQVDAHGRETISQTPNIYGEQMRDQEPIHGNNAVLTIDRDIQEAGFQAMKKLDRIGGLVAMKSNGEILAWLNAPSFDPNDFAAGAPPPQVWSRLVNDPSKPFRNKVAQDYTSPGSTFKPYVALAALQEKVIGPNTIVSAPGVMWFGRRPYHDSERQGHGDITVYEAIEESSNIFFYKMGIALGVDRMWNYISTFGLGAKTGVDLPREVSGILPNEAWKKQNVGQEWQPGENLSTAIGQGFVAVTPLQMAVGYNAIGTEGKVVKPFIVRRIIDQDGKVLREQFPTVVRDLTQPQKTGIHIDHATFKIVKEAMRRVANGAHGTGRAWKIPGVQMAGKTGTVQIMSFSADQIYTRCESRPFHLRHHGWYVAWAPWDNPEIVVAMLAEHSCHGASGAAPVVRDVIQAYYEKYHPDIIAAGLKAAKVKAAAPIAPVVPQEGE